MASNPTGTKDVYQEDVLKNLKPIQPKTNPQYLCQNMADIHSVCQLTENPQKCQEQWQKCFQSCSSNSFS